MKKINGWFVLSTIFVLLILIPNFDIFNYAIKPSNETWEHIKNYLLNDYIKNTIILCFFVSVFAGLIGILLAFIMTVYDFPLRNFLKWALILPLAIPPYIGAYTYSGMLSYTGVIQTFLRNTLNMEVNQKFFNILSMQGAIFVFTVFLFPYVYMILRGSLQKDSSTLIESARTFGKSMFSVFWKITLPISRVSIVGSVSLVILEVLSDYGVVAYFG
ncbi:MAG: ABC transporter permease, partial [Oscillospiraceae bacterium]